MTGVGCDGFHPKVLLDLTRETTRNRGAEWQMAATSLYDDVHFDTEKCYK